MLNFHWRRMKIQISFLPPSKSMDTSCLPGCVLSLNIITLHLPNPIRKQRLGMGWGQYMAGLTLRSLWSQSPYSSPALLLLPCYQTSTHYPVPWASPARVFQHELICGHQDGQEWVMCEGGPEPLCVEQAGLSGTWLTSLGPGGIGYCCTHDLRRWYRSSEKEWSSGVFSSLFCSVNLPVSEAGAGPGSSSQGPSDVSWRESIGRGR